MSEEAHDTHQGDVAKTTLGVALNMALVLAVSFFAFEYGRSGVIPFYQPHSVAADETAIKRLYAPVASYNDPLSIAYADGTLKLKGTIDPDAFRRVVVEVEGKALDVDTVTLDSPGGSLDSALALALFIREKGYETRVETGSICASSCPLILAAGSERSAGSGALIGAHQVSLDNSEIEAQAGPGQAGQFGMAAGQVLTGVITRHLEAMGVDPLIWIRALETPPDQLYVYSTAELLDSGLVTVE